MPSRKDLLETGNIYHVLSRSIQNIPIFGKPRQCQVFLDLIDFYNQTNPPTKFSYRSVPLLLSESESKKKKVVKILNYCLMPNHFHLTLLQISDGGITFLMQHVLNSFSHFYNKKFNSKGPLFQSCFKAIKVENIEQLTHLSRYIHLNPVTSGIVEKPEDFLFSSYNSYIGTVKSNLIYSKPILSEFSSPEKYMKFVLSQKNYQRKLSKIKKIILEQAQNFHR